MAVWDMPLMDDIFTPDVDKIARYLLHRAPGTPEKRLEGDMKSGIRAAEEIGRTVFPYIKHAAFRAEMEVRAVVTLSSHSKLRHVRNGKYGLTPYVELEAFDSDGKPKLPLKALKLGPGLGSPANESAVNVLLEQYGYEINVDHSVTPFR